MSSEAESDQLVLQRVVFPYDHDPQVLPLYLDAETWTWGKLGNSAEEALARSRGVASERLNRRPMRLTDRTGLGTLRGRRSIAVPAGATVSLASYFNAFPASYWNRWTSLSGVRLRVRTTGPGLVNVNRSNARGVIQRVQSTRVEGTVVSEFDVPFTSFIDGGWLWFDLTAGAGELTLEQADWLAPAGTAARADGAATICITTLNRGDYCTRLLTELGRDGDVDVAIDGVIVVDQGSERLAEHPLFPEAQRALGERLTLIEQDNIGGSGGFSRGMAETLSAGTSEYVLLIDDDVEIDPESVRRAVTFGNHCTEPTIVGGHMFDMYDKSKLHAFAEGIKRGPFMWGPFTPDRHDFHDSNLRQTHWVHRRFDVDYNGWWMCLIPTTVIDTVGLSMPYFIKWDDAEYALRAREHGFSTVSLPGAAVWHVSWVDKDDSHDWQAFFHARNRLVTALVHSREKRGGTLWRSNLALDLKNLLTMDYYTVAMRHAAMRSVLEGPAGMHDDMRTRLTRTRELGKGFREAEVIKDPTTLPSFPARENTSVMTSRVNPGPQGRAFARWLLKTVVRHALVRPRRDAAERPDAHLAYEDARWFEVPRYDSVLVTNAEGSGVTWHVRDPRLFRTMLRESIRLNLAYRRRWDRLADQYRSRVPELTSRDAWQASFEHR